MPSLPIPGDVLALRGAGTSLPSGVSVLLGASLQAPGDFGGRGNLGKAWGSCRGSSASSGTWQRRQQLGMAFFCWGLALISDFFVGALPLVTGFPPFFLSSNIIFPSLPLALLPSAPRVPFSSIKH